MDKKATTDFLAALMFVAVACVVLYMDSVLAPIVILILLSISAYLSSI